MHRHFLRKPAWQRPKYETGCQVSFFKYQVPFTIVHTGPLKLLYTNLTNVDVESLRRIRSVRHHVKGLFSRYHLYPKGFGCDVHTSRKFDSCSDTSGFTLTNRETTSEREPTTRITFPVRNTLLHGVQPGAIYLISEKQLVLLWHNLEARCGSLTCSRAGHVLWALAWRPWLLRLWQQPDWAPLLFLSFFFFLSFFPSIFILGHCAKPLTWSRVQQLYLLCLRRCQ